MYNLAKKVIRKILREINFVNDIQRKRWKFKTDKNYDFKSVEDGFKNRFEENQDDTIIINRICEAYNKVKVVQKNQPIVYKPSNEWLPIYEKNLKEVIDALSSNDIVKLGSIYRNFWRDPCSTGLVGLSVDLTKHYFGKIITRRHKKLWLNDACYRFQLWSGLLSNTNTVVDLNSLPIGNPYGYYIDG